MKIDDFWNSAFLAGLHYLSPKDAKAAADEATELCIKHWQSHSLNWAPDSFPLWQDQDIANVPCKPNDPTPHTRNLELIASRSESSR